VSTFDSWLSSKVGEARTAAVDAGIVAAEAAVGGAVDALTRAVDTVAQRRLPYSVTVGVTLGPVELSVTVEADATGGYVWKPEEVKP
jgi:hypothetical protein